MTGAQLPGLLRTVRFGTVILHIVDGMIVPGQEPRVRYAGKPRSHRGAGNRDPTDKPPPSQAEAIRDLLEDIGQLKGAWEVTVQVANSAPLKWDYEAVRPLRSTPSK